MFLMIGVNQERKELGSFGHAGCASCGSLGRYQVYMIYTCLSLFFIPILKWGRRYYVETSCCHSLYELNPEVGNRLRRGENVEIQAADLTLVRRGGAQKAYGYGASAQSESAADGTGSSPNFGRRCLACGYETMEDFSFCPKCGEQLRYKVPK